MARLHKNQRGPAALCVLAALACATVPAFAQTVSEAEAADEPPSGLRALFFDEADGKLDFSNMLAKGGFLPMPVIITEPAVDGGFGVVAQFISMNPEDPRRVTRRMLGGAATGNGSYGYGYFQSGQMFDGRVSYKAGAGRGKLTISAYPRFAPSGVQYTNRYEYGIFASVLVHFPDPRFSAGPLIDYRKIRSSLDFQNLPDDFALDFNRTLKTGALGFGVHFDSRDNKLTPTSGFNAYARGKFNSHALGSDRRFDLYAVNAYGFRALSPDWRAGVKVETSSAHGDYPAYFAPSINLRGIEAQRYQGARVVSAEIEVTRQLAPRWSALAFAGLGATDAGKSRVFADSGAIFSGGAGFRYRIARKLGLDAGVDVAAGPDGAVFYIQFGHAWGGGMD